MKYLFYALLLIIIAGESSCYYDKADVLYPQNAICDTTSAVTFSGTVLPILTINCNGCHSGTNPPLGIRLDVYTGVKAVVLNGQLIGAITHASGFLPMPQNGNQLSDCNVNKIKTWISSGSPFN